MTEESQCWFPPSVVSRVTGVPQPTLQTWMNRNQLRNLDTQRQAGKGKARLYSAADVYAIAIYSMLNKFRISSQLLGDMLPMCVKDVLKYKPVTEIIVRYYQPGEGVAVGYDDALREEPPKPGARVTLSIDARTIIDETRAHLNDVMRSAADQSVQIERPRDAN